MPRSREQINKTQRVWFSKNKGRHKKSQQKYLSKLKVEVLSHYNPKLICKCGFSDIDCLDIDHVENDGASDRKIRRLGPVKYRWLKKNNYPKGFQVLCRNCNWKKHLINLRKILKKKYD